MLEAVGSTSHGHQPLPATNAIHSLLVALLDNSAADHAGNLGKQRRITAHGECITVSDRRTTPVRVVGLSPGTIGLSLVFLIPDHGHVMGHVPGISARLD